MITRRSTKAHQQANSHAIEGFYPWLNREVGIDRDRKDFVVTYIQCLDDHPTEWSPPGLADTFAGTGGTLRLHPQ